MAVLELNALSVPLSGSFSATVIMPDCAQMENRKYPAFYFVHDVGGDDTDIRTVKNLQQLSNELGLFIIAPSLMHSFGMDLPWGGKYGDFLCRELPGICRHMFPLDSERQYIGGYNGGAYGAYWHAANHPDAFRKCVMIDGRFDVVHMCEAAANGAKVPHLTVANLEAVFGDLHAVAGSKFDILCDSAPRAEKVFFGCEEDFPAMSDNTGFAEKLGTTVHVFRTEEQIYDAAMRWLLQDE